MERIAMNILWSAFLVAIVAEALFFSLFDPLELMAMRGIHEVPASAGYSVGFFFFWGVGALSGALNHYLARAGGR